MHEPHRCLDMQREVTGFVLDVVTFEREGKAEAGVVDQNLDGALGICQPGLDLRPLARFRQVGDEDLGLNAAAIADLCGDGIQGCPVPTHEHDIRSPRCEAAGVLRAEARACPGDQNGLRHCAQPISEQVIGVTEPRGRSPRTPRVSSA